MATMDMASNMAKKAGNALAAGANKAYSNGESRKDKHSNSALLVEGRVGATQPICHGSRQREELL